MLEYNSKPPERHEEITSFAEKADPANRRAKLLETVRRGRAKIAAANDAARAERNAQRWKAERDPDEYQKQLERQRAEYAAKIKTEEGREVRAYQKVPGATKAEREENRRARAAERMRESRENSPRETKDKDADRKWVARQRKKGLTEEEIEAGLERRREERQAERAYDYARNPDFGRF